MRHAARTPPSTPDVARHVRRLLAPFYVVRSSTSRIASNSLGTKMFRFKCFAPKFVFSTDLTRISATRCPSCMQICGTVPRSGRAPKMFYFKVVVFFRPTFCFKCFALKFVFSIDFRRISTTRCPNCMHFCGTVPRSGRAPKMFYSR